MNLLIPYVYHYNQTDPLLAEFTYGDDKARAKTLETNLTKGDYVFFHTTIRGRKYITAYYVVDRVLRVADAIRDRNIADKYKNPHILRRLTDDNSDYDDVILFGDPITSRKLERPLLFDRNLAVRLSLNISFTDGKTETQVIGSATRSWRKLQPQDIAILLNAITSCEIEGMSPDTILSTDEVMDIIEKDIENFLEKNSSLVGKSLKLYRRQLETEVGRIDLLFQDMNDDLVVVELKLNKIGHDAISQIQRYINWLERDSDKKVRGVIVCKGVMPIYQEQFMHLKNIKILCYGWQLKVFPLSEEI